MADVERLRRILFHIFEISYAGHPDGRVDRLKMIQRFAVSGLKDDPHYHHVERMLRDRKKWEQSFLTEEPLEG